MQGCLYLFEAGLLGLNAFGEGDGVPEVLLVVKEKAIGAEGSVFRC